MFSFNRAKLANYYEHSKRTHSEFLVSSCLISISVCVRELVDVDTMLLYLMKYLSGVHVGGGVSGD